MNFQTYNVTASSPRDIVNQCAQQRQKFNFPVRCYVSIKYWDNSTDSMAELIVPEFFSYRFFEQTHAQWMLSYIQQQLDSRTRGNWIILHASFEMRMIGRQCQVCNHHVPGSWWEHVRQCGVPNRCAHCLAPPDADHSMCGLSANIVESALGSRYQVIRLVVQDGSNYEGILQDNLERIADVLRAHMIQFPSLKFSMCATVSMAKLMEDKSDQYHFKTCLSELRRGTDLVESIRVHLERIIEQMTKFIRNGSGWIITGIDFLDLSIVRCNPTGASGYLPVHPNLRSKQCFVNPQNTDNMCFLYACLAKLYPVHHNKERISQYTAFMDRFDMAGVRFPVAPEKVGPIERANEVNINIYTYHQQHGVLPVRISKEIFGTEIDLLLIEEEQTSHYALITNKSAFLRECGVKFERRYHAFFCPRCIAPFRSERCRDEHTALCLQPQKVKMPEKPTMSFDQYEKMVRIPAFMVCDFETLVVPTHPEFGGSTYTSANLTPSGFSIKVCSEYPEYDFEPYTYVGTDAPKVFIDKINEYHYRLKPLFTATTPMIPLTPEEQFRHWADPKCHICGGLFDPTEVRVADHNHALLKVDQVSNYIGPAHNSCNLRRTKPQKCPVIFHNLLGFDLHLFFKDLCRDVPNTDQINIIPKSTEKYISISTPKFVFIDSLRHLTASLSNVSGSLSSLQKKKLREYCEVKWPNSPRKLELLQQKLPFCYAYCTAMERLDDPIPEASNFLISKNHPATAEEYEIIRELSQEFGLVTVKDLQVLYNTLDVLLLCDVWVNYQQRCLDEFGLEPGHFVGCPSLAFAAALKKTGQTLQLLEDQDMYEMFERGIRGGVSVINTRFAQANNPSVPGYDSTKPKTHILYIDATNLYGAAMKGLLGWGNFLWADPSLFDTAYILGLDPEGSTGFTFDVDLECDPSHHDILNDFPLAPSSLDINETLISPYSQNIRKIRNMPAEFSRKKLAPSFLPKTHYVVALPNLQYYLNNGYTLKAVHRVISYSQKKWMDPFISDLSEKRRDTNCKFEKLRYKLTANASFGKLLQNCRDYSQMKIITNEQQHQYQTRKPSFKQFTIFDEDIVALELGKDVVTLDRPIYCGFSVLEQSKLMMQKMFYEVLRKKFPSCKLLMTDTDSFIIKIESDNLKDDLYDIRDHFDFSNLPESHELFDPNDPNRGIPGRFKIEADGKPIYQFCGIRSKLYSILFGDESNVIAACGVQRSVKDRCLRHKMFLDTLKSLNDTRLAQDMFRSLKHNMQIISTTKTALTPYDDKRFLKDDGIESLAYGHRAI